MALVYKKSDSKKARAYERSPGMEPNMGVTHMTVVSNPSRRRKRKVSENPFQWIEGRGQRHRHVSPPYEKVRDAIGWKKRRPRSEARLYPVDERGTVVSRPVSKKLLSRNSKRSTGMAYNIGALRRAMKSNPNGRRRGRRVSQRATSGGMQVSSRKRTTKNRKRRSRKTSRKTSRNQRYVVANKRRRSRRKSSKRRTSRRSSRRRRSRRRVTANKSSKRSRAAKKGWRRRRARASARGTSRRSSRRRVSRNKRRSSRRRVSRRRASRRRVSKNKRRSSRRRAPQRRTSRRRAPQRRRSSRRRVTANRRHGSRRRASRRTSRRRASRRRGSRRRVSSNKRTKKRRTSRRRGSYHGTRRVSTRGREYLDKYISKGLMPTVAPVYRTGKSRSGRPPVLVYPISKRQGRLSSRPKRRTSKSRSAKRRSTRATSVGASYRRPRRGRRQTMAANKRRRRSRKTSRRGSRRSSRRRRSRRRVTRNRRRSRRSSRRRSSRRSSRRGSRRRSSRRRRLTRNILSTSKARWGGRGKQRTGRPVGRTFQVLTYGPRSKSRSGKRIKGYPVYIPGHVVETASVRRYRKLGGAAKDSHARATSRGYRERKKYAKRRVTRNRRRTSMRRNKKRRTSVRRNQRYVVANKRRRRRRLRRNQFLGVAWMKDVVTPVIGGTAGFVAARVLSNGLANVAPLRNVLDKGAPAAAADNTKIAANVVGIVATLGLSTRVPLIQRHRGALITGMGLALTDRLLGKLGGDAAGYLGGFGEYVSQPLGEYVSQPLGAYVADPGMSGMGDTLYAAAGVGEYVNQPLGMYNEGVDPADQSSVDGLMDVMEAAAGMGQYEAAAGMGTEYATAGMGTLYAAAGLGAEADVRLKKMYAREQPPFVSIQTPTSEALRVTQNMPFAKPVPSSLVTPEGRGYAGGLFSRHLFGGMF